MIVVEINGGLGNQMFQYAFGMALAHLNNTKLELDISEFNVEETNFVKRNFELDIFDFPKSFCNMYGLNKFKPTTNLIKRVVRKINPHKIYKEPHFSFDKNALKLKGNYFFQGYWQSERYFSQIANNVRTAFDFKVLKNEQTNLISNQILATQSVSIHIRRGDYVTSPQANATQGLVGINYYYAAIKLIENKLKNLHYFIFSDDITWVKQHIVFANNNCSYITHNNGKDSWQDMYLMSLCKYNIIANSSFSWWGAWLNNNINKIVIAPMVWFVNEEMNKQTQDLIPLNWQRI